MDVRWSEYEYYDVHTDSDVVRMMGTTSVGTYFAKVHKDGPISVRMKRQAFRDLVLNMMDDGNPPCEVVL
jgi:hypothetical protein